MRADLSSFWSILSLKCFSNSKICPFDSYKHRTHKKIGGGVKKFRIYLYINEIWCHRSNNNKIFQGYWDIQLASSDVNVQYIQVLLHRARPADQRESQPPRESTPPGVHELVLSPPTTNRADLCNEQDAV